MTGGTDTVAAADKREPAAALHRRTIYAASEGNRAERRPTTARYPPLPERRLTLGAPSRPPARRKGGGGDAAPPNPNPQIEQQPEANHTTTPMTQKSNAQHRTHSAHIYPLPRTGPNTLGFTRAKMHPNPPTTTIILQVHNLLRPTTRP